MNESVREKLRRLVRLPESRYPFTSVYLDTKTDTPQKNEEARIFLKNAARDAEALLSAREDREAFERDAERILRFFEDELHRPGPAGHAIFACGADDVFEVIGTRRPFRNEFLVSRRPLIRQLAVMLDEYEPVAAVVLDSRTARIFEISVLDGVAERELQGDVPRNVQPPEFHGYGDLKYQRDVKGHVEQHWKEVGDYLARLVDRGYRRLVVLGQDSIVQNFRRLLPHRVNERIVASGPMDIREARDRVVARALEAVRAAERRLESNLIGLIRDQALSGNLGVIGLEATLDTLRKGQVYKLAISDELRARGWRCRSCAALATHLRNNACPHCGGGVDEVELGDEVVKDAIAQGAEVETVRANGELARLGKIGALLRFRE